MDYTDKKEEAIGIFDSGVGGISVLKVLQKELPHENFIFFGDQSNAPYGEKSEEELRELALSAYHFLQEKKVKATVIACNTATSAAAQFLRENFPKDIIVGMEPAVKPAALSLNNAMQHIGACEKILQEKPVGKKALSVDALSEKEAEKKRILVMATESTLKGDKLHHLIDSLKDEGEYILLPAPGIVRLLEQGKGHGEEMQVYLKDLLSPYKEGTLSSVVLGCTHFPFVKEEIRNALGYPIPFFDGAFGTAKETKHRLEEKGLLRESGKGHVELFSSTGDSSLLEDFYRLPI